MKKSLLFMLCVFTCGILAAQQYRADSSANSANNIYTSTTPLIYTSQPKPYFFGVRVYHENDVLTPVATNMDDNYTGGIKLEFITNTYAAFQKCKLLNPLQWTNLSQQFSFGFTVFTPRDIASTAVVRSERPYASFTFFAAGASFINQQKNKKAGYELLVGSMGKPLPGEIQKKLHRERWLGSKRPIPAGWDYEIANGGAFAANVNLWYQQQLTRLKPAATFEWTRLNWKSELNLGQYITNVAQALRVNLFNYHAYYGESEPPIIIKRMGVNEKQTTEANADKKLAFTFFIEPRVRLMVHNATLTGKLLGKPSVHTVNNIRPVLLEYEAGAQVRYCFATLGYTISGRSKEYRKANTNFHHWGGFYLSLVHQF